MTPETDVSSPAAPRRAARDIIEAVLENFRTNLEPLKYSILAPSRFVVYLHPAEHARIQGIAPILEKETVRALTEELDRLNRRPGWRRHVDRFLAPALRIENAAMAWHVEFLADADGELAEGDILVDSELMLPPAPELGAGDRTRRVTTRHATGRDGAAAEGEPASARVATRVETIERPAAAAPALGTLRYEDNAGSHVHEIARDSVTVGRGGLAYRVDVRIEASADVSREHLRIRRDAATGRFYVVDLSSLGTTVDGRRVPRGYDEVDGSKRENGVEAPLPERARIGLADTVFLDFEAARR
jgi:hypothetical protein